MEYERLNDRTPTFTEQFKECLPFYLSIGMTVKEFWEGDCTLPVFYRKAYEMKQKSENEMNNFNFWLQGRYFAEAIASCFSKNHSYPDKPYGTDEKEQALKEKNMSDDEIMLERADRFRQFVNAKKKQKPP
ncbi:MAG: hypothetical protein Q4E74_10825 [Ruminococcus sp.]|nr:hypothetical protein [Ruminococcus sp.]